MSSTSAAVSSSRNCFNSDCKELKPERSRKGWRLRTGEFAELCDGCASAFQEGRFCDTFHLNASGWRSCSCGKGSNSSSPPYLLVHSSLSDRFKDDSAKGRGWSQLAGLGTVPWRQVPSLFNSAIPQSELHFTVPYEVDFSTGNDKLNVSNGLSSPCLRKKKIEDFSENLMNGSLKLGAQDIRENGNAGINCEKQSGPCLTNSQHPSQREEQYYLPFGLTVPYTSPDGANGQIGFPCTHLQLNSESPLAEQFHCNQHNRLDASGETPIHNGRPRPDGHRINLLFHCSWPRFTDADLQQTSGEYPFHSISASDAGRIGRLVLPKKSAEAYFPPISQSEGLPLKVQNSKGKEWVFQFRFWPNNNSRMYVLEGVTPCLQDMQLQAGDIEAGGKLIMGFRKAAPTSTSEQADLADPTSFSKFGKSGHIAKEPSGTKPAVSRKRKNSSLGSKSNVVVIGGVEFEEYEDDPILGRPTIFASDNLGEIIQWAQCEDCFKWRRLPSTALLPYRWTCSSNSWDPERSLCSAAQELTAEQLEDLLPRCNPGEGKALPASSQATTKHSRHRPDKELDADPLPYTNAGNTSRSSPEKVVIEGSEDDLNRVKSSNSSFKGQIDLNIRPEREEELSSGSDSGNT
ncbi:HSI2-like 1 isoform 2 [Hibiscus syriacus]|uniref:HSI2-like 1 isoform 2 n=1 Tax=Hibiscus syriacus TaxID=106335 RepID=A0A6A3C6X5_HIBSY|nr:HSI2-like 1 isoform 2 [Hibiscus syriacus]